MRKVFNFFKRHRRWSILGGITGIVGCVVLLLYLYYKGVIGTIYYSASDVEYMEVKIEDNILHNSVMRDTFIIKEEVNIQEVLDTIKANNNGLVRLNIGYKQCACVFVPSGYTFTIHKKDGEIETRTLDVKTMGRTGNGIYKVLYSREVAEQARSLFVKEKEISKVKVRYIKEEGEDDVEYGCSHSIYETTEESLVQGLKDFAQSKWQNLRSVDTTKSYYSILFEDKMGNVIDSMDLNKKCPYYEEFKELLPELSEKLE